MTDRAEIERLLAELGEDEAAAAGRRRVCEVIASSLGRVGNLLWVSGYMIGPDRVSGASPYQFGDDRSVGVATVAQIGGELATGAIGLLTANNKYAASALIRQLVEVEYLACAFADQHEIAADWLRADRDQRRKFWSPERMRERTNERFLRTDYWHHCEMGGHPTTRGMQLLPNHKTMHPAYLWTDLAGHLVGIWKGIVGATALVLGDTLPDEWKLPDVQVTIDEWRASDSFNAAMSDLATILHDDPDALSDYLGSQSSDDAP